MTHDSVIRVHETTLPHLDLIEKILLDELVRQGKAEIITEEPDPRAPGPGALVVG